jgi:hypothetical protein
VLGVLPTAVAQAKVIYKGIDLYTAATPGGESGTVNAIAPNGQAAGSGSVSGNTGHAFFWTPPSGAVVDLNPPSGFDLSSAYGIEGTMQGGYGQNTVSGAKQALLWSATSASVVNLHPSGLSDSLIYGMGGGQQVGVGYPSADPHAYLWTGTATSAMDLNPADFSASLAVGAKGGRQVGEGSGPGTGGRIHALLGRGN